MSETRRRAALFALVGPAVGILATAAFWSPDLPPLPSGGRFDSWRDHTAYANMLRTTWLTGFGYLATVSVVAGSVCAFFPRIFSFFEKRPAVVACLLASMAGCSPWLASIPVSMVALVFLPAFVPPSGSPKGAVSTTSDVPDDNHAGDPGSRGEVQRWFAGFLHWAKQPVPLTFPLLLFNVALALAGLHLMIHGPFYRQRFVVLFGG